MNKPFVFPLAKPTDRDPRPGGNDLGNILRVNRICRPLADPALTFKALNSLKQAAFLIPENGGSLEILGADRLFFVPGNAAKLLLGSAQIRRWLGSADAKLCRRLVEKIDRLVGKAPVGNIANRQIDCGSDGSVGDPKLMVRLVAVSKAKEDRLCLLWRRLSDLHRLKAPFKSAVLFDIAAVFRRRRCADDAKLSARKGGLEDVCRINRPLGGSRTDDRVDLVNKENDRWVACRLRHDRLHPLLKLPSVFGSGDHPRDIKRHDRAPLKRLGDVAVGDHLCDPLNDRRFADPRLSDQARIVLGPSAENTDNARDLILSPNDRVKPSASGRLGQVPTVA